MPLPVLPRDLFWTQTAALWSLANILEPCQEVIPVNYAGDRVEAWHIHGGQYRKSGERGDLHIGCALGKDRQSLVRGLED